MSYFVVDVEADGPCPGLYSMVSLGAVEITDNKVGSTFYTEFSPISEDWIPEALAISGFSREETLKFESPESSMIKFNKWIKETSKGRPIFISDNIAFDWMWVCYYSHKYLKQNPFGFSGRRIADIICGLEKDLRFKWKDYRKTKHTHNPVDDALGNAEAFIYFLDKHNLKI